VGDAERADLRELPGGQLVVVGADVAADGQARRDEVEVGELGLRQGVDRAAPSVCSGQSTRSQQTSGRAAVMGRELGRFLEHRRHELGLSRRELAERSGLSYPYISQLETGDREPALKAMRALAPVLDVRPEELAALVAGGNWATTGASTYASAPLMSLSRPAPDRAGYNPDKVLLSLERRLREVPPLERIALLNQLIAAAVDELATHSSR
jgi:transcriptional regulator with XRE-family HTH domain